jgi:tRNA(adenine34) deaminase
LPGCKLYVTLEPCAMCVGAMLHARVASLVFGAPDPKSGAAGSVVDLTKVPSFNHYVEVFGGVEAEASAKLLKEFFRGRRLKA